MFVSQLDYSQLLLCSCACVFDSAQPLLLTSFLHRDVEEEVDLEPYDFQSRRARQRLARRIRGLLRGLGLREYRQGSVYVYNGMVRGTGISVRVNTTVVDREVVTSEGDRKYIAEVRSRRARLVVLV